MPFDVWETCRMAKYIPREGDVVFRDGEGFTGFVITRIDAGKKTADVKSVSGLQVLTRDVPWSTLHHLDESQNALRIVREATEGQ
jgi:hypothetical protein